MDRQVKIATGTILVTARCRIRAACCDRDSLRGRASSRRVLKDAVVVPQRAVSEVQGSYQLGIVGADGKAEIRPVKAGSRTGQLGDYFGLEPGEKVVVEGMQKVRAGAAVVAKPWTPPARIKRWPAPSQAKPAGNKNMSKFFINRPIVAMVISIVMTIVGVDHADLQPADRAVPEHRPAGDPGARRPTPAPTR